VRGIAPRLSNHYLKKEKCPVGFGRCRERRESVFVLDTSINLLGRIRFK
jgi:hypothetical protein